MELILGFIYLVVTGAVIVSMAVLFLRGNRDNANKLYMAFQGMVVIWCGSQILGLLAHRKWEMTVAYLFGNIGICLVGMFWLFFALVYAGKKVFGIRKYIPIAISVMHYILVCTNGWHHLYYAQFTAKRIIHGPFFFSNVVVTYIFIIIGAILIFNTGVAARNLIVISVLIPVIFNAIYLTGIVKANYDITPLGFAISVYLTMLATVKYQFIDLKRQLAITNEKLLLEQERNRIAQQVHDTAGHTLTMIQSYMKLAELAVRDKDNDKAGEYLSDAKNLTSKGIRELRESINQLRQEAEYGLVTQGIMQLANQVKEIPVEVTIKGEDSEKFSHLSKVVYDTVRESITNTLKYAEATKIEIIVRFQEKQIQLTIGDNGKGCANMQESNGIRGIKERAKQAGGSVRFLCMEGEGFLTTMQIPV